MTKYYEQNNSSGTINNADQINQNFYVQYPVYKKLVRDIEKTKRLLKGEDDQEERKQLSEELQEQLDQLNKLKADFSEIQKTVNESDLKIYRTGQEQFKEHFYKGELREANDIFSDEDLRRDLDKVKEIEKQVQEKRKEQANIYLLKAQSWAIMYDESNHLKKVCEYFETALQILREGHLRQSLFAKILSKYALFLERHKNFDQAQPLYEEALQIYRELEPDNLPDISTILHNLGHLHSCKNELDKALDKYKKALDIRKQLAENNSTEYLPYVITTIHNLAAVYSNQNKIGKAINEYKRLLLIEEKLAKQNPEDDQYRVSILHNLAQLHVYKKQFDKAIEKDEQALQIMRQIIEKLDPKKKHIYYLPFSEILSNILNKLALSHVHKNEVDKAIGEYEEALEIKRKLAKENDEYKYLPDIAIILIRLSILYLQVKYKREKSIILALESIEILLLPQFQEHQEIKKHIEIAIKILEVNQINLEDIKTFIRGE